MHELSTPSFDIKSPRIVIDDREPHDSIAEALKDCGCTSTEVRRLAVGDYHVNDTLLVERKSLVDLIASIIDGRLFSRRSVSQALSLQRF